jgi:hypothetical protein
MIAARARRAFLTLATGSLAAAAGCASLLGLDDVSYSGPDAGDTDAAGLDGATSDAATPDAADGCSPCAIAQSLPSPTLLAADEAHLYWISTGTSGEVGTCALETCADRRVLATGSNLEALAAGGAVAYFSGTTGTRYAALDGSAGPLYGAPSKSLGFAGGLLFSAQNLRIEMCILSSIRDGGCNFGVYATENVVSNLALGASFVTWQTPSGLVLSCRQSASCQAPQLTEVAVGFPLSSALARSGTTIAWVGGGTLWATASTTADAGLGSAEVTKLADGLREAALAVDGDTVYATTVDGLLRRWNRFTKEEVTLATGLATPRGLVVVGPYAYVSASASRDGTIWRVNK